VDLVRLKQRALVGLEMFYGDNRDDTHMFQMIKAHDVAQHTRRKQVFPTTFSFDSARPVSLKSASPRGSLVWGLLWQIILRWMSFMSPDQQRENSFIYQLCLLACAIVSVTRKPSCRMNTARCHNYF